MVIYHHLRAGDERDFDLTVRQNREYRCDLFDGLDIEFGAQCEDCFLIQKSLRFDLDKLSSLTTQEVNFISRDILIQVRQQPIPIQFEIDKGFVIVTCH